MAKTRRSYYLDDEALAFIEDLVNSGIATSKSQAVRRAVKTAAREAQERGASALSKDDTRKYGGVSRSGTGGSSKDPDDEQQSSGGSEGGGSGDLRAVPGGRPNGDGDDKQQSNEVATPNREGSGKGGNNSSLSNLNPFN